MIFERRAYTLRPGKLQAFWNEQETWNTKEKFGSLLERNIGYFSAATGSSEEIVHLYRFELARAMASPVRTILRRAVARIFQEGSALASQAGKQLPFGIARGESDLALDR